MGGVSIHHKSCIIIWVVKGFVFHYFSWSFDEFMLNSYFNVLNSWFQIWLRFVLKITSKSERVCIFFEVSIIIKDCYGIFELVWPLCLPPAIRIFGFCFCQLPLIRRLCNSLSYAKFKGWLFTSTYLLMGRTIDFFAFSFALYIV